MRVLIVEDERDLVQAIVKVLSSQGYAADVAYDGEEALVLADVNDYDVMILDLNLPKIDGIEVCRRIRKTSSSIGILMLTARSSVGDRVIGLDMGADDYLVKPFHFSELLARVRAILRRESKPLRTVLKKDDLVLDPNTAKVFLNNSEITLTVREFAVLEYLMRNSGQFVSQEELLEHVWNEDANLFTQAVKTHIKNIRKKLGKVGGGQIILTVRGRGYTI